MSYQNNEAFNPLLGVLGVLFFVASIIFFGIKSFSDFVNSDFKVAASFCLKLSIILIVALFCLWRRANWRWIFPIALAATWVSFCPVLDNMVENKYYGRPTQPENVIEAFFGKSKSDFTSFQYGAGSYQNYSRDIFEPRRGTPDVFITSLTFKSLIMLIIGAFGWFLVTREENRYSSIW